MIKRLFDFFFSLLGLVLFAPLFLLVALLIKLTSIGPVFFRQQRVGQYGRSFWMYKFRTMEVGAEKKGQLTVANDPRVTKFGSFLRKTNMDELPQLANVLRGEMSLVGPRPEVPKYVALYTGEQREVLNSKPGMTDYASLEYRNESELLSRSKSPEEYYIRSVMPEKLSLNLEYIRNRSMGLDIKLIVRTVADIMSSIYKNSSVLLIRSLFRRTARKRALFYLAFDSFFIALSMYWAFYLRFEGKIPEDFIVNMVFFISLALLVKVPSLYYEGLYNVSWTYTSLRELLSLVESISFASFFFGTLLFFFRAYPLFAAFPRSVLVIDYMLTVFFLGSFRGSKRIYLQYTGRMPGKGERVLIIGAGNTGEQIVRNMQSSSGYLPAGFLDDDPGKLGSTIHGVKVLGKREEMGKAVKEHEVESILIAMPSAPSGIIRETVQYGRAAGIKKIKIIPNLQSIISGNITLASIKEVELEDLLGREQVEVDTGAVGSYLEGKTILVTGASGSIGSELCKQVLNFNPGTVLALDQDETGLFWLRKEVRDARLLPIIGNIRDADKIDSIFSEFRPDVVFHAAAYKHVPAMEEHPDEAVKNNVFGTLGLGEVSIKYGVQKFILVSTDKAVNPTSVMGATKRLAEKVIVELDKKNNTKFAAVRFGNVLGSRGSVVPVFKEQIMKGGPIEVTHPEVKRYFMVTSEAVLLILQAGAMASGGEVFVLDMGEPVKIADLAREMIRLSGFEPDKDIPVVFTGLRRGEKLYEDLLTAEEGMDSTHHRKIFRARLDSNNDGLAEGLGELKELSEGRKNGEIISLLCRLIPTYNPAR